MDGGSHASGIGLFTIDQPFLGICALHSRFGLALAQSPGRKERDEGNIYGEERSRAYRSDFDPPDKSQILRRKRCEPTILLWMLGHASNLNTQLPTPCVLCNRLRESSNINQSLLTLGTVINALSGMADAGDGDDDSRPPSPGCFDRLLLLRPGFQSTSRALQAAVVSDPRLSACRRMQSACRQATLPVPSAAPRSVAPIASTSLPPSRPHVLPVPARNNPLPADAGAPPGVTARCAAGLAGAIAPGAWGGLASRVRRPREREPAGRPPLRPCARAGAGRLRAGPRSGAGRSRGSRLRRRRRAGAAAPCRPRRPARPCPWTPRAEAAFCFVFEILFYLL